MKKYGIILACVAGSTVSSIALADPDTTNLPPVRAITLNDIQGGDYERGSFGSRVDLEVYSNGIGSETGGGFAGPGDSTACYDDVTFGGPGATGDVTINGIAWGCWLPAGAQDQLYMRVTFFEGHDSNADAVTAPYSGATVVWDLNLGTGWAAGAGAGLFFANPVTFGGAGALLTDAFIGPDRKVGVKEELYLDAAFTTRAVGYAVIRRANHTAHVVGSSDEKGWYAPITPGDGAITGTNLVSGTPAGWRGTFLKLQGTGYTPPVPTMDYDLGCITDGVTSLAVNTAVSQGDRPDVAWASVCLAGDALDNAGLSGAGQFFDAWVSGASDISIAIYDSVTGDLIASDSGDGPDGNGQFSFGIGRRAAITGSSTDGKQRDGNNYYLGTGLANGTYHVAFAPAGSTFSGGWGVTPGVGGGAGMFSVDTNVNGAALAASVAPAVDSHLGDNLVAPGAAMPAVAREPYQVSWYSFSTCAASSDVEPVIIDMLGSAVAPAGSSHAIFDANGVLLASSTIDPGEAPDLVFDGTNVLPAGTYYVAQTWENAQYSPFGDRWHVRSQQGSNGFNFGGTVNIFLTECPVGGCPWQTFGCTADQDGDDDVDSDDIVVFFSNFENGETCGDQDADEDVDSDDIVIFFGLFEQGGC